jgi:hypothetical protein
MASCHTLITDDLRVHHGLPYCNAQHSTCARRNPRRTQGHSLQSLLRLYWLWTASKLQWRRHLHCLHLEETVPLARTARCTSHTGGVLSFTRETCRSALLFLVTSSQIYSVLVWSVIHYVTSIGSTPAQLLCGLPTGGRALPLSTADYEQ